MKNTDTPSIERLKHCPFCGGEAGIDDFSTSYRKDAPPMWGVGCDNNKCIVEARVIGRDRDDSVRLWNTRATLETLPSAGEGVERLREVLQRLRDEVMFGSHRKARDLVRDEVDAALASPPLEQPDIEGRHCNRCAEDLAPTQMLCPFCDNPSVPLSEARSSPDIARELLASKRPYRVFDYYSDVDGVPDQQNFMVSTLSPPQHPVALCGPDRKFADALCAMLNSLSLPTTEIRREAWQPIETAPRDGIPRLLYWPRIPEKALPEHISIREDNGGPFRHPTHWQPLVAPLASPPSRPSFDKWDYAAAALADARCSK